MYEYLDRRYALALYKIAEERGKVGEYLKDLKEIQLLIENNNNMLEIIEYPNITISDKKKMFTCILKNKIDDELLSFILILIEKGRILYLKEKIKEFEKIYMEENNCLPVYVKSVIPLNEHEKLELVNKLKQIYKKKILLHEEIDEKIIGGIHVKVGNDIIDGTIKSKYEEMKKKMKDTLLISLEKRWYYAC